MVHKLYKKVQRIAYTCTWNCEEVQGKCTCGRTTASHSVGILGEPQSRWRRPRPPSSRWRAPPCRSCQRSWEPSCRLGWWGDGLTHDGNRWKAVAGIEICSHNFLSSIQRGVFSSSEPWKQNWRRKIFEERRSKRSKIFREGEYLAHGVEGKGGAYLEKENILPMKEKERGGKYLKEENTWWMETSKNICT